MMLCRHHARDELQFSLFHSRIFYNKLVWTIGKRVGEQKSLDFYPRKGRDEFRQAFVRDYTELKGARSSRTLEENKQLYRGSNGKFQKHPEEQDPLANSYLTYSWGVGKNFPSELEKTIRPHGGSITATTSMTYKEKSS